MDKITRNIKLRSAQKKLEFKTFILKSLIRERKFDKKFRLFMQIKLHKLNFRNSKTKITNYCVMTQQSKSINRKFSMDRHTFKVFCAKGLIMGIEKTGW